MMNQYAAIQCMLDVEMLKEGFAKFGSMIQNSYKEDRDNHGRWIMNNGEYLNFRGFLEFCPILLSACALH